MSDRKSSPSIQRPNPSRLGQLGTGFTNYHKHASMYSYENGMSRNLVAANNYLTLIPGWTGNLQSGSTKAYYTTGTGRLTCGVLGAGLYYVYAQLSLEANKVCQIHGDIFKNGVEQQPIAFSRDITTSGNKGSMSMFNTILLVPGDYLDIRLKSSVANTTITVDHAQFGMFWIAGGQ